MISRIPLTGKQLGTLNLRPDICKKSGAQIVGKELVGAETHLKTVKTELERWLKSSGQVTLEMDLRPIIEQIDQAVR